MARRWLAALNLWLLFGSCMLCGAVGTIMEMLQPMNSGIAAEGEIIKVLFGSRYNPRTVDFRFRDPNGTAITASAETSPFQRYEEGQRVTVYYNPDDLEKVFLPDYLWFIVTLSVVGGFLVGVLLLWFGLRKWWRRRAGV